MKLTGQLLEAFAGTFLSGRYDNPMPTPSFHKEVWDLYCSEERRCGCAAPRNHAKSTSFTYDYALGNALFRESDFIVIISSTEEKAIDQVFNISDELHTNKDLVQEFGVAGFDVDQKSEIVVRMDDGHTFKIMGKGSEQKLRGTFWKGKRPNLIICDDMEDDEQVESKDRRRKFKNWFFRAVIPALSQQGRIRVHGTILHEDSLLSLLRNSKSWKFLFYQAHRSYEDFSDLLWPERWSAKELRAIQIGFEEIGDSPGYAQEYLNNPLDNSEAYLKKTWFLPITPEERNEQKQIIIAGDFAISKADKANRTSFTVGGRCLSGVACIVDQRVGRWDSLDLIENMFTLHLLWNEEMFFVEDGQIWKSLWPVIRNEMFGLTRSPALVEMFGDEDIFINFVPCKPVKDKSTRGRSMQKRMRAGGLHFDKQADWFPGYEDELLRFTTGKEARLDDQFDSTAWLCIGMEQLPQLEEDDFTVADEIEEEFHMYNKSNPIGRSTQTGY